jgi:cytochrome c-type biogenesis protein CcmF
VLLFRGKPTEMEGYWLTYQGDTTIGPNHYYSVRYIKKEGDRITEEFVLKPNAQINPKMGLVSNPDTKHYLTKDVFTYITSTIDKSKIKDTTNFKSKKVKIGDSIYFANGVMVFNGFDAKAPNPNYKPQGGDVAVAAKISMLNMSGDTATAYPVYYIRNKSEYRIPDTLEKFELQVQIGKIIPEEEAVLIEYKQPNALNDYIIMKAIVFPYINVLWLGTILMIIGFLLSLYKRFTAK